MDEQTVQSTESNTPDLAAEVEADVAEWRSKDMQAKTADLVNKTLTEAGVTDEGLEGTATEQPDKEFAEEKARLAAVFKKKNEVLKERESAKAEAETIKAEAIRMQAHAQQLMAEAQRAAEWVKLLKSNPLQALASAGVDPEEFIMALAEDPDPHQKKIKTVEEKLKEFEDWKSAKEKEVEEWQRQAQAAQWEAHKKATLDKFYSLAKSDQHKHIKSALEDGFITEHALEQVGHQISNDVFKITGKYPSLEEVVEYIDEQYGKAYSKRVTPKPAQDVVTPPKPRPVQKTAVKTLSLEDGSERRALEAGAKDEVGDDRREKARQAVKAVLAKAGKKE